MKTSLIQSMQKDQQHFMITLAATTEAEKDFCKRMIELFLPTSDGIRVLTPVTVAPSGIGITIGDPEEYERLGKSILFIPKSLKK